MTIKTNDPMVIPVRSTLDAMNARMVARKMANEAGFDLKAQASIALATWSLAGVLGLGTSCQGEISIDSIRETGRVGMRVVCSTRHYDDQLAASSFGNTGWIVDELRVDRSAPDQVEVTAIKWEPASNTWHT